MLQDTLPEDLFQPGQQRSTVAGAPSTLGLDSVCLASLCEALNARFGSALAPAQVASADSFMDVQAAVLGTGVLGGTSTKVDFAQEVRGALEQLKASLDAVGRQGIHAGRPRRMLMTGVTGYVGIFTLRAAVMDEALENCHFSCLVRSASAEGGLERIRLAYVQYELDREPHPWRSVASRITVVCGELPASLEVQDRLVAESPDVIVHNGARVNHVLPYQQLRPANVQGTADMLRLAARCGSSLAHISTVGFLCHPGAGETAKVPVSGIHSLSGYAQTKWVADQLVSAAAEDLCLVTTTLRLGLVAGSRDTGAVARSSTFSKLLAGLARVGLAPLCEDSPLPARFPIVPVDWCAEAIVAASVRPAPQLLPGSPVAMHLAAREPVSIGEVVEALSATGLGVQPCSREAFAAAVRGMGKDHPLYLHKAAICNHMFRTPGKEDLPQTRLAEAVVGTAPPTVGVQALCRAVGFLQRHGWM